jgi:hypothetical protein
MACGSTDSLITLSLASESKTHGYPRRIYALNSRWTGDVRGKALAKTVIRNRAGKNALFAAEVTLLSITELIGTDGLVVGESPSLQRALATLSERSRIEPRTASIRRRRSCIDERLMRQRWRVSSDVRQESRELIRCLSAAAIRRVSETRRLLS